ncbi:hypothetical protein SASPL_147226 [Salvia splendens]|uniref:Cation/H+ exchanger transmembrane domain-containing protein n=1 Tax=Salvia splendens TaxID=180675 RepID=A0A8X8Z5Y6_SALSN|nr:hypothetical protein SASPL_147226 [Salvia splendens]
MGIDLGSVVEAVRNLTTSDHASVVSITLCVTLLCASVVIGHLLEESPWMNESITALLIGVGTGVMILLLSGGKSSHLFIFSEDLFFIYLLPPIIFNAGFQVKKKQFFQNFATIMMFGAIGTLVSFSIISLGAITIFEKMDLGLEIGDYLAIGAIFAATDSVCTLQVQYGFIAVLSQDETPLLYSLVFGEGVVNDATSVVLFNAIQDFDLSRMNSAIALQLIGDFIYLFISSTVLGVFVSYFSLFFSQGRGVNTFYLPKYHLLRATQRFVCTAAGTAQRIYNKEALFWKVSASSNSVPLHSTDREVAIMMLMAYLSYMSAELFYLSGILTVFFCGIVMSHYTWHNVTQNSRVTTKHTFATMSFVAETFIFLYVGMDALDIEKWTVVSDRQITIWWSGLMRGAVSMALAYNQFTRAGHTQLRGNAIMITSTITVVLFSTVVCGLITKPLVRFLMPSSSELNRSMSSEPGSPKSFAVPLLGSHDSDSELFNGSGQASGVHGDQQPAVHPSSLRMFLTTPSRTIHYYWRKFDNAFMRPVFGGRGFVPYVPASPTEPSVHEWPAQEAND